MGEVRGGRQPFSLIKVAGMSGCENANLLPACRPGVYTQEDKLAKQLRGLGQARVCSSEGVGAGTGSVTELPRRQAPGFLPK